MKNLVQFFMLLAIAGSVMVGCTKENSGATGATGPAGPAGPAGSNGANGTNGSDSVTYSNWITLAMNYDSAGSDYLENIPAPALTQRILDSGFVLGYVKYVNDSGVTQVSPPAILGFAEIYTAGQIELRSFLVDYSGALYRYVLVPGSVAIGNSVEGRGYSKADMQKMTYEQVQKILASSVSSKSSPN